MKALLMRHGPATIAALAIAAGVAWMQLGHMTSREPHLARKAAIGGPFRLTDHAGRTVTDETFRGKAMLVFFGYRFCPDVCPTDLQVIAQALDLLGPEAAAVQALFVSVDPERDTPSALADYVSLFHPGILGLTGSPAEVKAAAQAYKTFYVKVPDPGSGGEYLIDHSAFIYVMGPDGRFSSVLPHGSSAESVASAARSTFSSIRSPDSQRSNEP
jgi:protein SCO1/2